MASPEQQHLCPTCGRAFSRKGDLTRHRRGIHGGERPHVCRVCFKAFSQASGLKTHKNVHTGSKPFVCGVGGCSKAFGDPSSCTRHRKETHRNADTYNCPVSNCNSRIKRRSAFAAHLRKHGWDTDTVDLDRYTTHKRVSRSKAPADSGKPVVAKTEPVFFTPTPLPAHHGATSSVSYSQSIPYANHPHPSYHTGAFNNLVFADPLPNNIYPSASSRVNTPGLASSSSSSPSGSAPSLCPTPEQFCLTLPSINDTDRTGKMLMPSCDTNTWSLESADNMYRDSFPYLIHDRMTNGYGSNVAGTTFVPTITLL
ncbi:hypothetical protein V5O48_001935 [Marasmius crinis-equi]|uniref:C2H2-type domain-containing protein n=1 Tax=Marasmius crinis-equi TaxID=585013 RepID=A0ABR3FX14_9AGAR